jgi:hypothetical protein
MRRVLPLPLVVALISAAAAQKVPSRAELDKLMATTDDLADRVAKLRGLPVKKALARGIMSRAQIEARVKLRLEEEYAAVEIAEEERAMKRLGLFPAEKDYKAVVLELLGDQIAGFYDPEVRELYIADWIDVDFQRMVMAHEIAHALQDQTYDLRTFVKPLKDNSDQQLARQALVEGDGIAVMIELVFREGGSKGDPWASPAALDLMRRSLESGDDRGALARAPLLLRDWLLFPYVGGMGLIAEARRLHPWSRVDEMYRRPPTSTEQVLHPRKYFAGEGPVPVRPVVLPSLKGWKVAYSNVLGELLFSVLFGSMGLANRSPARRRPAGEVIATWLMRRRGPPRERSPIW